MMAYSLLTERRRHAPPGAAGGAPGARAAATCSTGGPGAQGLRHPATRRPPPARDARRRRTRPLPSPVVSRPDCFGVGAIQRSSGGRLPAPRMPPWRAWRFLGLGIMGHPMAASLRRAGHELTVFQPHARAGGRLRGRARRGRRRHAGGGGGRRRGRRDHGRRTGRRCGRSCSARTAAAAVGAGPGTLCLDMSTIAPGEAREIGAALAQRGLRFVDAPVTGSSPRARDATLTIMAGGAPRPRGPRRARCSRPWAGSSCTSASWGRVRCSSSSTTPSPRRTRPSWRRRSSRHARRGSTSTRWFR
jgi:hypothetical protein